MKMQPLFPKKEKPSMDKVIMDTDVKLRMLKDKYSTMLSRELRTARYNKSHGKTDSKNYSKIGIAYYSLNIVDKAQTRLQDIYDNRELCKSMGEMSAALGAINGLSVKVGDIDVQDMMKKLKKMDAAAGETDKRLVNALGALSGSDKGGSGGLPIESLVDRDIIEKLINGASVEECVNAGEGVNQDVEDLFQAFSQDEAFQPFSEEDLENNPEDLTARMNDMINQLL